jgi:hypothetical protein
MTLETIGSVSDNSIADCPPWPPDTAVQPARQYNPYATSRGTIATDSRINMVSCR